MEKYCPVKGQYLKYAGTWEVIYHGKASTEPQRDHHRQWADVPLSQAGPEPEALSGQHFCHQPAGVLQDQYDARRPGYEFTPGGDQGIFGEEDPFCDPGDHL